MNNLQLDNLIEEDDEPVKSLQLLHYLDIKG